MAQNDVPLWVDDGSLGFSPRREPAPATVPVTAKAGPWSPAAARDVPAHAQEAAASFGFARLGIGLAQGFLFFFLFRGRADGFWPGNNPFLFDAIALPALFLPWSVMAGLGRIALPRLALFAALATAILAALGWYHRWRIAGAEIGQPGLSMLLLAGAALFLAQSFLEAAGRNGRIAPADFLASAWTLAARLILLLPALGLGLLLVQLLPGLALERGDIIAMPFLGLCGALALQLGVPFAASLRQWALATATVLLPVTMAAAVILLCTSLVGRQPPLAVLLALMGGLVIAIGASWQGGAARPLWREGLESVGALLLPLLAGLAVWELAARVTALGWTAPRLFAAAALALLCAYALCYSLAAVFALVRGHGLKGLGVINLALAGAALLGLLALASPLADPLRLAPLTQAARLVDGRVTVERFDFVNLGRDGARFGNEALAALSHSLYPDIARAAAQAQGGARLTQSLNPTEIGANIAVRTPGARLPATLLARDWSQTAGAPPCLTTAAQACEAFFLDLNGDQHPEILLVTGSETRWWAAVMEEDAAGRWRLAGRLAAGCGATLADLRAGHLSVLAALPGWDDLQVAGARLSVTPSGTGCSHY